MRSRDAGTAAGPGTGTAATLGGLAREIAARLKAAGIEEPAGEARRIVAHAASVRALDIVARPEREVSDDVADAARQLASSREQRQPLSRILGEREFYGRPFWLSPGTLDPRPETELLVEMALEEVRGRRDPVRILDAGTGTGAIAISLLAELPGATALGIDLSEDALATARRNAERHGISGRLRLERRDMLDPTWIESEAPFDLVVSNPPYIPSGDIAGLDPEVRLFDPPLALDGGPDGLAAYRALCRYLGRLTPGGAMMLEVGAGQAEEVARLLSAARFGSDLAISVDLLGHGRVVAVWPHRAGAEG